MSSSSARRALRARARGPEAPVDLGRKRSPCPGAGIRRPIGHVRWRKDKNHLIAHVKTERGWRPRSHVVWEQAHGPIPAGKVVLHLDGDRANDALENLGIGTTDDALALAHMRNPRLWDSPQRRRATAEMNRERSALRRLAGPMPNRWYLVDDRKRAIWNGAWHSQRDAARAAGVRVPDDMANGLGIIPSLLGWPDLKTRQAAFLAAVCEAAPGRSVMAADARARAVEILAHYRYDASSVLVSSWSSVSCLLRRAGLIRRVSHGPSGCELYATEAARAARGPSTDLRVVHARDLPALGPYEWLTERGHHYQREDGVSGVVLLAQQIAGSDA